MPQPWITVNDLAMPTHPDAREAVKAATHILWELSGRRYSGVRTVTEVYRQLAPQEIPEERPVPVLHQGRITNTVHGSCLTCGCTHMVKLRGVPVVEIEAIRHSSGTISLRDVAIMDYTWIAVSGGSMSCWGTCDDLTVTYMYGARPSPLAVMAVRELANQFLWFASDDERCALPQRVTSISRQGVSFAMLDPQDFLDDGRTGIYQVDLFLRAVNPEMRRRRARVFSPDLPSAKTSR